MNTPGMCIKTGCGVWVIHGDYALWGDLFYVGDCAVLKFRGGRQYGALHRPAGYLAVDATEAIEHVIGGSGEGVIIFPRATVDQFTLKQIEDAGGYTDFVRRFK